MLVKHIENTLPMYFAQKLYILYIINKKRNAALNSMSGTYNLAFRSPNTLELLV